MKNLKFITLLRSLEEAEVLTFSKYLKLHHGKNALAGKVFQYVRKCYPDFENGKKLDMAYAYRKIFHTDIMYNENNRKKMLNALSDLHLWLKEFLLIEKLRQNTFESEALWLGILQERKLEAEFSRTAVRFYIAERATPQRDINDCIREIVAGHFYYKYLSQIKPFPDIHLLQNCTESMEASAEIIQLKMAVEMANIKKIRPSSITPSLQENLSIPMTESPMLLLMYRELYQLVATEQEPYYFRLESLLIEQAAIIAPVELHGMFRYLYNYVALQIRNGKELTFGSALHQLNKFGLDHNFFTQQGVMSATEFANIVNVAATAKDFNWAASFITEQNGSLPVNTRKETVLLAEAIILFEKQRYKECLKLIEKTEFRDTHLIIRSRTLILRSYFELKEDVNVILDLCTAFEVWLYRKRKPKTGAIEATISFISIFKMLLFQKTSKKKLLDAIEKKANLYFKTWLLAKTVSYTAKYATRKQRM